MRLLRWFRSGAGASGSPTGRILRRPLVRGLAAAGLVAAAAGGATGVASAHVSPGQHGGPAGVALTTYRETSQDVQIGTFAKIYDPAVGDTVPSYINDHTIVRGPDGTWHLFGITHTEPADPTGEVTFAHATAPTLHGPWTKQAPALTVDPSYGEVHLWAPHVIRDGNTYYMFYAGGAADSTKAEINLATSTDLYHWTRLPSGPLFTDGFEARDPMVLKVGSEWVIYYCATDDPAGGHHIVAYRTSTDLVHWSDRHVAYTSPDTGTGAGNTESPFVVHRGGAYYLFIGPCGAYAGGQNTYDCTDVYKSADPFHFTTDQHVGRIAAHAPEVVQDTDGRWYITNCGWGAGGVYLAPLNWQGTVTREGVRVATASYEADVQTSPSVEIRSLRRPGGVNLVDDAYRGLTPYAGVGGYGDDARPGVPHQVRLDLSSGVLQLRGIPIGHEPITADWTLTFRPGDFDSTLRWHVTGTVSAPVYEAGLSVDTALPHVGDTTNADRTTGDVFGWPSYIIASDGSSVTLAAGYKAHSAWQEYDHWSNNEVGEIALQSINCGVGYIWNQGDYDGGTWRFGISPKPTDTAFAAQLAAGVNS